MSPVAYIGIGSNLGDRRACCARALELLAAQPGIRLLRVSPWYESEAVTPAGAPVDQPPYLNGAAAVETALTPEALLAVLLQIEEALGRPRDRAKGAPRSIDLDLLLFEGERRATPALTLPHPRLSKRVFVLQPLYDIAPHVVEPLSGLSVATLLERCRSRSPDAALRRRDE